MHLDDIVNWIDSAFGEVTPSPAASDEEVLAKIFGDSGYQRFLQDQVNRQIIRDYLTNAVVLGEITQGGLAAFASQLVSEDSRATLALFMLMSSIEEAKDLVIANGDSERLKPLKPVLQPVPQPAPQLLPVRRRRTHIKLVPN